MGSINKIYTGGIAATNGYVHESSEGIILFDAPEGIAKWLTKHQIAPKALILTHQHFDHVMDAAAVKASFHCPIYAWEGYSQDLTLETLFAQHGGFSVDVPPFQVDHELNNTESLDLLGIHWTLFHIPGHSPDSVCLHDPASHLLMAGDVLFAEGVGRTDFPGGSHKRLISGIKEKLLPLPDQTQVYPGHGPDTTIGHERQSNPYLV
jgi:glyoxylase-like metal-dependent hydrolase (beta-lactamase superfamily II)